MICDIYLKTCEQIQGIDTSCIIWGFHSETEEELCTRLDEITLHNIMWVDFRRFGCAWWVRNNNTLQRVIEKVIEPTFINVLVTY